MALIGLALLCFMPVIVDASSPSAPFLSWDGRMIPANEYGNPSGVVTSTDEWEEFLALSREAVEIKTDPRVWKIIYCLAGSADMLRLDGKGMLHPEKATMTTEQRDFCLDAFSLFEDMVIAYTRGAVRIESTRRDVKGPWHGMYEGAAFFHPHDYPDLGDGLDLSECDGVIGHFYAGPVRTLYPWWTGEGSGWCLGVGESSITYDPSREGRGQISTLAKDTLRAWLSQAGRCQEALGLFGMPVMDSVGRYAPNPSLYLMRWIIPPSEWRTMSTHGAGVRVPNRPVSPDEGFIQEWLFCGPCFAPERYALGRDFFSTKDLTPTEGDISSGHEWRLYISNGPEVTLRKAFPVERKDAVIFAHAYVFSESDTEAKLWMGGSSPFTVSLNDETGVRVWDGSARDTVMRKINLKAGWNRLLVKILDQGDDDWWFTARITGADNLPSSETVFTALRPDEEFTADEEPAFADSEIERFSWEDVRDDPWGVLPVIDEQFLDKLLETDGVRILSDAADASLFIELPGGIAVESDLLKEPSATDYQLNNQLSFRRETMAYIRRRDGEGNPRDLILMRPDMVEPFLDLSRRAEGEGPRNSILGYVLRKGMLAVAVETVLPELPANEFAMLTPNDGLLSVDVLFSTPRIIRGEGASVEFRIRNVGDKIIDVGTLELSGLPGGKTVEIGKIYNFVPTEEKTFKHDLDTMDLAPGIHELAMALSYEIGETSFSLGKPLPVDVRNPVEVKLERKGSSLITRHEIEIELRVTNRSGIRERGKVELDLPSGWKAKPSSMSFDLRSLGQSETVRIRLRISDDVQDGDAVITANSELKKRKSIEPSSELRLRTSFSKYLVRSRFDGAIEGGFAMTEGLYKVGLSRDDPAMGASCLVVDNGGGSKYGHVWMFDQAQLMSGTSKQTGDYSFRTSDYPMLDFMLSCGDREQNLGILISLDTGETCGIVVNGEWDKLMSPGRMIGRADFTADGKWRRVAVNMEEILDDYFGNVPHHVSEIKFGDVRQLDHGWWTGTDNTEFFLDEFSIRKR